MRIFNDGKTGIPSGLAFEHDFHAAHHCLACRFNVEVIFNRGFCSAKQECEHCSLRCSFEITWFAVARGFPGQVYEAVFFVVNPVLMRDSIHD